jgi:hypothetical protein
VWCITQQASLAIQENAIAQAQGYCAGIIDTTDPNNTAREECYFSIAEMLASQPAEHPLQLALHTCALTHIYQEHCYSHITEIIAQNTEIDQRSIQDLLHQIQQYYSHDPIFANKMRQYYSTLLTLRQPNTAFVEAQDRNSSMTLVFIQKQISADKTLEEWKGLYKTFVEEHENQFSSPMASGKNIRNMWDDVRRVNLPYRYYLSQSLRPYSKDIEEDWALALVAALQQQKFPTEKIKQSSNNAIIQWMLQHR